MPGLYFEIGSLTFFLGCPQTEILLSLLLKWLGLKPWATVPTPLPTYLLIEKKLLVGKEVFFKAKISSPLLLAGPGAGVRIKFHKPDTLIVN
jgi:hypothetical protein